MSLNPTTQQLVDLYIDKTRELKKLKAFVDSLKSQLCTTIELGEFEEYEEDGRFNLPGLTIVSVQRGTFAYSKAVAALKEQEEFEGIAKKKVTSSYSFKVLD